MTKKYFKISKKFDLGLVDLLCYTPNESSFQGGGMKIEQIEIKDVGGVPYLKLDSIDPQMNIICGENGVGKTTILESIAYVFTLRYQQSLKKRVDSERGDIQITDSAGVQHNRETVEYNPGGPKWEDCRFKDYPDHPKHVLYLKSNRDFGYEKIVNVFDPDEMGASAETLSGVKHEGLKAWLYNHSLYISNPKSISKEQLSNIKLAHELINKIDSGFSFERTDVSGEVLIRTPTGVIFFEYLSSGFKSAFYILLGIIKEINSRFQEERVSARDFEGVVLIDEVELHLHPEWQRRICSILKESFPKIQFFVTTHSPHVIQGAGHSEVIPLAKKISERVAQVCVNKLPESNEYGFQGWTIEEILTDVMGMSDTRSQKYNELIEAFDSALDDEDADAAKSAFNELEKMLHPSSHTKKLLKLQMAGLR